MRNYESSQELRRIKTQGSQATWISSNRNTLGFQLWAKVQIRLFYLNESFLCLFFTHIHPTPNVCLSSPRTAITWEQLYILSVTQPHHCSPWIPQGVFCMGSWTHLFQVTHSCSQLFSSWRYCTTAVLPHWCDISVPRRCFSFSHLLS